MNKGFRLAFILVPLVIAFSVFAVDAQNITGSISGGSIARGSSGRGVITVAIPAGLHMNSNRPSSQYAIPTTVRLSAAGARVGAVNYPRGANRKFEFSENPINVYEGTVRFPFTIKVPANFRGDTVRVRATVKYQACTNEVCYPPKTKEITLTAKVR
jgi:DsbC/DsbD-like thiol-disulfide interchange protein